MPLIGEDALQMIRNFRLCWVGGRFGGGKTSLMLRIAYELIARGYAKTMVGNFPCVWFSNIREIECRDCVICLDEAGVWLEDKEFNKITAFLRKKNVYVILASVLPVALRAKAVTLQRTWNLTVFGIPMWRYTVNLDYMNLQDKFSLNWWRPHEIYGIYDTDAIADDDRGIASWVIRAMKSSTYARQLAAAAADGVAFGDGLSFGGSDGGAGSKVLSSGQEEAQGVENYPSDLALAEPEGDFDGWGGVESLASSGRIAEALQESTSKISSLIPELNRAARRARRG